MKSQTHRLKSWPSCKYFHKLINPFCFAFSSPEAVELSNIVKQLGLVPDLCVEEYILNFFKYLNLKQKVISTICPTAARLTSLKVLNLSFNCISRIENLPPNLEELYLNGNQVDHITLSVNKPFNSMYHLGLNRNKIRQTALSQIVKIFPNLFCLDLSFNDLCEIESAISWIKNLSNLKMLALEGNPLILTPNYQKIMVERMPNIKVLDSVTIPAD